MPEITFKSHEILDHDKLKVIYDNWESETIQSHFNHKDRKDSDKPKLDSAGQRKAIFSMLTNGKTTPEGFVVQTRYQYAKKQSSGRQFACGGVSLGNLQREIRGTIASQFYHDIDIKMCHLQLFLQYCEKKSYPHHRLEYMVANYDKLIGELITKSKRTKSEVKKDILAVLNGGKRTILEDWFVQYQKEIGILHQLIMNDPSNAEMLAKIKKTRKKQYNVQGSLTNHILCEIENSVLMSIVSFLKSKKISTDNTVLCFDGLMIPKSVCTPDDEFLNSLSTSVEKTTSYRVQFLVKPISSFPLGDLKATDGLLDPLTDSSIDSFLRKVLTTEGSTHALALLTKNRYPDGYKMTGDKGVWYVFNGNKWVVDETEKYMSELLTDKIAPLILTTKSEDAQKIYNHLMDITFRFKVIKECATLYEDITFFDKLDTNYHLLGFTNGVYDFEIQSLRKCVPEDYISLSCGFDYIPYDISSTSSQELMIFLKQLFPYSELLDSTLILLSSCICDGNTNQLFNIWTGCGANGKSKFLELICDALGGCREGSYYKTISSSYFTQRQKEAVGAPMPDITRLKGCRIITSSEPEEGSTFNTGKIRDWTGNEIISAREMYARKLSNFRACFSTFFICNKIPAMPSNLSQNDKAVWRRALITQFLSQFKDTPDPTNPLEFKRDIHISEKMANWKQSFMGLLIETSKLYCEKGLLRTKYHESAGSAYHSESSNFYSFAENNIEKNADDLEIYISLNDIWDQLKHEKFFSKSIMKKDLKDFFKTYAPLYQEETHIKGQHLRNVFRGIRWACDIPVIVEESEQSSRPPYQLT